MSGNSEKAPLLSGGGGNNNDNNRQTNLYPVTQQPTSTATTTTTTMPTGINQGTGTYQPAEQWVPLITRQGDLPEGYHPTGIVEVKTQTYRNGECKHTRRRGCFSSILTAPFDPKTYAAMFYFMTINFIFAIFCFVWVVVGVSLSLGLTPLFLIGPILLFVFSFTWRILARMELGMVAAFCRSQSGKVKTEKYDLPRIMPSARGTCMGDDSDNAEHHVVVRDHGDSIKQQEPATTTKKSGCMKCFTTTYCGVVGSHYTWRSFGYFIFVKFFLAVFAFAFTVAFLAASIGCVGHIFQVIFCGEHCYTPVSHMPAAWIWDLILNRAAGAIILTPVGIVLYFITCQIVRGFAALTRWTSYGILADKKSSEQSYMPVRSTRPTVVHQQVTHHAV